MIKKIAILVFYILVPAGVFFLLGFAIEKNVSMKCNDFKVFVVNDTGNSFVDSLFIINEVYRIMQSVEGQKLKNVSLKEMEEFINTLYYVEKSQVYRTIDGEVVVNARQREPLVRVVNMYNESYYLDRNGLLMRVSPEYTARVMVAAGHITARYSPVINLKEEVKLEDVHDSERKLRDLYSVVEKIHHHAFLNAWVDQIYLTRSGEFELVPMNGSPIVELGKAENIDEKLERLLLFYENGLTNVGWNQYKKINLRFENQIVCSK